jgi:hypothetical protein
MKTSRNLIAILATCAFLVACDDGPTAPRTRLAPTPKTPNVAGNWHGTVDRGGHPSVCGEDIPVAATFSQDGTRITGTVTMMQVAASTTSQFLGDVQGSQLTGTLTATGSPVAVTGTASSTRIVMRYGRDSLLCRMPVIELVR